MDSLWESNLLIQFAAVFIFAIYKIAINSASPFVRVVLFFVRVPRVVFFFVRDFELCYFSPEILSCASLRAAPGAVLFFVQASIYGRDCPKVSIRCR